MLKSLISSILAITAFTAFTDDLQLIPSFESCSIYLKETGSHEAKRIVKYRKSGTEDKWLESYPLVYDNVEKEYRGSIVYLQEDTAYEVEISGMQRSFKTWTSNPPIAKTIFINELKTEGQLVISDKGTEDGWIKYSAPKGYIFTAAPDKNPAILFKDAKFVILENLTITGSNGNAIHVLDSENIRILNCDISGWGQPGTQDFQKGGQYFLPDGRSVGASKMSGINIDKTLNLVIERCYIHDPNCRSNAWRFSHPNGPSAIYVRSLGGTVIRYNDLIGSDPHRWDDVIEGWDNGSDKGSVYRDADIYGNMFAFANDDGIELDGGQMNSRFHHNKIEGCLCGISTAPCFLGPSYIFNNLILNLSDDSGTANCAIKNNSGWHGRGQLLYFNNTVLTTSGNGAFSPYIGIDTPSPFIDLLKGTLKNNIFISQSAPLYGGVFKYKNIIENNIFFCTNSAENDEFRERMSEEKLAGNNLLAQPEFIDTASGNLRLKKGSPGSGRSLSIPGFCKASEDIGAFVNNPAASLPYRPLPVSVDKEELNFHSSADGKFKAQEITIKSSGASFKGSFSIKKNKVFDWFEVTPDKAEITGISETKLTVRILPEKLEGPWIHRGIFLIRFADGLSRPVTVYVNPGKEPDANIPATGTNILLKATSGQGEKYPLTDGAIYLSGKDGKMVASPKGKGLSFDFEIPKNGKYMIFLKMKSDLPLGKHDSCFFSLDGNSPEKMDLPFSKTIWTWKPVLKTKILKVPGTKDAYSVSSLETMALSKGKHSIRLYPREAIYLDCIFITDNLYNIMNPRGY